MIEICVKTDSMIGGYYKNEPKTKETFVDGWVLTGDIGEMEPGIFPLHRPSSVSILYKWFCCLQRWLFTYH
jgi:acyl-CoA synthetase (AMP-forming)/AMP-acid ligase II